MAKIKLLDSVFVLKWTDDQGNILYCILLLPEIILIQVSNQSCHIYIIRIFFVENFSLRTYPTISIGKKNCFAMDQFLFT